MHRRQVFQPIQSMGLEAPFILVKLAAVHAALPTSGSDVSQGFGQLQYTQSLSGDLLSSVHLIPLSQAK